MPDNFPDNQIKKLHLNILKLKFHFMPLQNRQFYLPEILW